MILDDGIWLLLFSFEKKNPTFDGPNRRAFAMISVQMHRQVYAISKKHKGFSCVIRFKKKRDVQLDDLI